MAISSLSVGNVQTGGLDTNGGFFVTGATGTDYSKQTTPQYSVTDGVTAVSTTVTSATASFGTDVVGNGIYISGGTGPVTSGWYQILTRVNSTTITVDRNIVVSTGVTLHVGGCWQTIQQGINGIFTTNTGCAGVADAILYIKKGSYTGTVALNTTNFVGASSYFSRIIGYNSTVGDNPTPQSGNQPNYAVGSGAGVNGITFGIGGIYLMHVTFTGTATSGTRGVIGIQGVNYIQVIGCKVNDFSSTGISNTSTNCNVTNTEVVNCGGTGISGGVSVNYCWSHKNSSGITGGIGTSFYGNLVTNNTNDAFTGLSQSSDLIGNTVYGNGRDGAAWGNAGYSFPLSGIVRNNIFAKCGRYGISQVGATTAVFPKEDYNAFYSNTTSNYNGITAGPHDIAISINPFNSSDANLASETSPDWGLNNTASAGASLRAVGFPGNIVGLTTTTGYIDIGAIQHQDSGGGSTSYTGFFMS